MEPEWIITTEDDPEYRSVSFKEMFQVKDRITSLTLLWTYNSYYVNVTERYFIINGGRRVALPVWKSATDVCLEYAKRHTNTVTVNNGSERSESISYVVGINGRIENEEKQLLIHVSSDGRSWGWKNHR